MALTSPGVVKTTDEILVALAPEITMVKQFTYDISNEVADYGAKVRIPFITAGEAEQYADDTCATPGSEAGNYEHPTGSLSDTFITLDYQPKVTIPITSTDKLELPNDSFWSKAKEAGVNVIGRAISKKLCSNFTAEKCLAGKIVLPGVSTSAIAQLRSKAAKKGRIADYVLVLNGANFNDFLACLPSNVYGGTQPIQEGFIPRAYGFKAVMASEDLPEGVTGALVPSDALGVAIRPVAIPDPTAYPECGVVTDEQGFALTAMRHTAFATAKAFYNVTTLIGADIIRKNDTYYISAS